MCCIAACCPFIIWAQAHKQLHGLSKYLKCEFLSQDNLKVWLIDPEKGMRGYWLIILGFAFMYFVSACIGNGRPMEENEMESHSSPTASPFWFIYVVGIMVSVSLLRSQAWLFSRSAYSRDEG
jgi:tellurite resistance protein TehA-like permease